MVESDNGGQRVARLRAELAALPPDRVAERARLSAELGVALADRCIRTGPEEPEALYGPMSSTDLDEMVPLLAGAGEHRDAEVLIRLGTLLCVRFMAFTGAVEDREASIAAFRELLTCPEIGDWRRGLARLHLGILLMSRLLPPQAWATTAPDIQAILPLVMASATEADAATAADIDEAYGHLRYALSAGIGPTSLRNYATLLLPLALMVRPGSKDYQQIVGMLEQALSALPADAPGRVEAGALLPWLKADLAGAADDTGQMARALDEVRQAHGALAVGHPMRGPLQHLLGTRQLGSVSEIEATLDSFTRALAEMDEDNPFYDITMRSFGGALLTAVALDPARGEGSAAGTYPEVDRALAIAEQILDRQRKRAATSDDPAEQAALGRDHFLYGMALALSATRSGSPQDMRASADHLQTAMRLVPEDDELAPVVAGCYAAILNDQHLLHGSLQHAEAAQFFLDRAEQMLLEKPARGPGAATDLPFHVITAISRVGYAWRMQDADGLAANAARLHAIAASGDAAQPWRSRVLGGLALAHCGHGILTRDLAEVSLGLGYAIEAGDELSDDRTAHQPVWVLAAIAQLLQGVIDGDPDAMEAAIPRLEQAISGDTFMHAQRAQFRLCLGVAYLGRYEHGGGHPDDLHRAVERLTEAKSGLRDEPGEAIAAEVSVQLARAHRLRADHTTAVAAGLDALRALARDVLLQVGAEHGLVVARSGADQAHEIALWALADGGFKEAVEALELGRGLVLHSAAVVGDVPQLLATAGADDLAKRWRTEAVSANTTLPWTGPEPEGHTVAQLVASLVGGEIPADLRRRALAVLGTQAGAHELFTGPGVAEIGKAVAEAGADALVYLVSGSEGGWAIAVDGAGATTAIDLPGLHEQNAAPLAAYATAVDELGRAESAYLDAGRTAAAVAEADGQETDAAGARMTVDRPSASTAVNADDPAASAAVEAAKSALREAEKTLCKAEKTWRAALEALCDWAWPGIMEQVLRLCAPLAAGAEPRVVLVPCGMLGIVAWPAARRPAPGGGHRYACQDMVLSQAASGRQLVDSVRLGRKCAGGASVLVANPDGTLDMAVVEVDALRSAFYKGSAVYGMPRRRTAGPGSPDEVLTALTRPGERLAVFHCASHAVTSDPPTRSALLLAPGGGHDGRLPVAQILAQAEGRRSALGCDLVVLSACLSDLASRDHDEALTLATAFMAAGAANVVGSRWRVRDSTTAVLMFMFHHYLVAERQPVADALRSAQLWMLDPDRTVPATMPAGLRGLLYQPDRPVDDLACWAAFTHQGGARPAR